MEPSMEQTQQSQHHQPTQQNSGVSVKVTIIIFIILIAAGLGVAYFFNQKLANLEEQNATLVSQTQANQTREATGDDDTPLSQPNTDGQSTSPSANTPDRQIITGQARQEATGEDVLVECYVFGDSVDEVWLRYGNTLVPQEQTPRDADAIGETEADVYGSAVTSIPGSELEPGGIYTYRCYGTSNGETVKGGTASFTTLVQQQQPAQQ
jgi:type II secretory pathway pseudopilin PulG